MSLFSYLDTTEKEAEVLIETAIITKLAPVLAPIIGIDSLTTLVDRIVDDVRKE